MTNRVVVTGMGMVSPLGLTVQQTWDKLISGKSGLKKITHFNTSDLPCKIAGIVEDDLSQICAERNIDPKSIRRTSRFCVHALIAAAEALKDADWNPTQEEDLSRTAVMIGSGIGGLDWIENSVIDMQEKGPRRLSPFFIPGILINMAAGNVAIQYGFTGPTHSVVTACATGNHAIGDATQMIRNGIADVVVAGGTEAAICRIALGGFCALKALSTNFNEEPEKSSRPWDKSRDGFVMGEGSGILILEEYEHAKKRNAKIYAEIIGYGLSGDAHHITAPHPEGLGAQKAMIAALKDAKLDYDKIQYINAHGTSTAMGDEVEIRAIRKIFKEKVPDLAISSTKSSIGHLLGAAGAVEAIFSIMALQKSTMPATLNLDNPDEECKDINLIAKIPQEKKLNYVMSNSFGFGGTNATLIFKKI